MKKMYSLKGNYRMFMKYLDSVGALAKDFNVDAVVLPELVTPNEKILFDELLDIPPKSVIEVESDIAGHKEFRYVVNTVDNGVVVTSRSSRNTTIPNSEVIRVVERGPK